MCKYTLRLVLSFGLCLLFFNVCNGQTAPLFEMSYFEDVASKHSITPVREANFVPATDNLVNLGITKSTLWVKIILNTKVLQSEAVLEVKTPLKDSITLTYELENQKLVSETLGIMYPYSKNKLNHYVPAFIIPIQELTSPVLYIKVKSRYSMFVPISIKTKENFYKGRVTAYFIGGLLIGGLVLIGFYNLFLFFSIRDFSYLLYVLSLFSAILSQGYIFGVLIPYLSPEWPEFSFRFPILIMACTGIFSCWFTIRFLEIKKTSTILYSLLLVAIGFSLFNIVLELLGVDYLSRKINLIVVISLSLLIFSSALYSLIKGKKIALYFTIAWTFYLFGMIVFALKTAGILPHNAFTAHFMHIGTFMEVILLSFALGHKYSLVRVEKERLERQTRAELEELVNRQTVKLEASLEEKEVLLKEVHHRVKNNLQIVISLLDLQVASVKGVRNKQILVQSKSRVYSMSLIHQKLYQSDNLAHVNMKSYLEELFTYVKNSYATIHEVSYKIAIADKELSITKAVPLGLIVNELLTNSFKYGLQNNKKNNITMSLEFNDANMVLQVADSGDGFDENAAVDGLKKSLGLFLVKSLSKQLRSTVSRSFDEELFVTKLIIPLEK